MTGENGREIALAKVNEPRRAMRVLVPRYPLGVAVEEKFYDRIQYGVLNTVDVWTYLVRIGLRMREIDAAYFEKVAEGLPTIDPINRRTQHNCPVPKDVSDGLDALAAEMRKADGKARKRDAFIIALRVGLAIA